MVKRTPVTQKQIAKEAGVSQTVVSLVLNHSYNIDLSDETRQRVLDVADILGYVPQVAAQTLVKGNSANLGLILVQPHFQVFRDPYIPNVITGLSNITRATGFRLLVEHINDLSELSTVRNMLKGGEVAGILLSNVLWVEAVVTPLIEENYPIVVLDKLHSGAGHVACLDHISGIKAAIAHLTTLGHRRVACITYAPADHPHIQARLHAFREGLASAGITHDEAYLRYGNYDPDSGYEAMRSLLQHHPHPTAVFGMNDLMALGAMHAIHEAGLKIPDDIAVVGYDDMRFAAFTSPTLTTVRAPEVQLGEVAGQMLVDLIHGKVPHSTRVELIPELIIRDSCGYAIAS